MSAVDSEKHRTRNLARPVRNLGRHVFRTGGPFGEEVAKRGPRTKESFNPARRGEFPEPERDQGKDDLQYPGRLTEGRSKPARVRSYDVKAPRVGEEDSTCRESSTFELDLVREPRSKPRTANSGKKDDSGKQVTKMEHRRDRCMEAEKCDEPEGLEPGKGNPARKSQERQKPR